MSHSLPLRIDSREVRAVDRPQSTTVNAVDRTMEWLGLVARAFGRSGLTHKAAAITMEIDPAQLSAQLAGVPQKHLSFGRLSKLGPDFWREMVELICEFHGIEPPGMTSDDMEALRIGKAQIELHRQIAKAVSR
jgi:hypothetical protein